MISKSSGISIIIPIHKNTKEELICCLESIQKQINFHYPIEVIIVQDESESDYSEVISEFSSLNIVHITNPKTLGLSYSRNKGINISTFEFLLFLDADDLLDRYCLIKMYDHIKTTKSDLAFSNFTKFNGKPENIVKRINSSEYFNLFQLYKGLTTSPIFHSIFIGHALCVRKSSLQEVGGFNIAIDCGEITDLCLSFYSRNFHISHVPDYLYYYRDNSTGLSKRPNLNENRISSIKKHYSECFKNELSEVEVFGRLLPYNHLHFNLYDENEKLIRLPYVNYDMQKLENRIDKVYF
jgi:glycosyltransferase involved in cell wall biosynthesis